MQLPAWHDASGARHPGIALSVHEGGPRSAERPAVVLCHGFPELAYSWRHQFPALTAAGFRTIAADGRGYGASDCPAAIAAYGIEHLAADLVGLLDALEIERAVFVGHDWGGFVTWAMPLLHPERTAGVIGVNTPYMRFPTTHELRRLCPEDEHLHTLWFQAPGVAEAVLDDQKRLVFEKLMCRTLGPRKHMHAHARFEDVNPFRHLGSMDPLGPALLSPEDLDAYVAGFTNSGFAGGIHWYRNIDANAERLPDVGRRPLTLPCLMITAEWDGALPPVLARGMDQYCSDLEMHMIAECGHWTQQEKPAELNRTLVDWLGRRFGAS